MSAPRKSAPGISIREFARRDGCSEKLVRNALESGHLRALRDGKLDPKFVGTGWRKTNRRSADTSADSPADTSADSSADTAAGPSPGLDTQGHGGALKRATRRAVDAIVGLLDEPAPDPDAVAASIDDYIASILSGRWVTQAEAEKVKENGLALQRLLDARHKAGALVPIAIAEQVLFDTHRGARDSWLNWPVRIGPLLAADLGLEADRVTEALTAHVHQHLADLGEPEPDFAAERG